MAFRPGLIGSIVVGGIAAIGLVCMALAWKPSIELVKPAAGGELRATASREAPRSRLSAIARFATPQSRDSRSREDDLYRRRSA